MAEGAKGQICDVNGSYKFQWRWQGGECGKKLTLPWSTPFQFKIQEQPGGTLTAVEEPIWAEIKDGLFHHSLKAQNASSSAACKLVLKTHRGIDDAQGVSLDIDATLSWKPGDKALTASGTLDYRDWDEDGDSFKCKGRVAVSDGVHK